jgi:hypothetical protein
VVRRSRTAAVARNEARRLDVSVVSQCMSHMQFIHRGLSRAIFTDEGDTEETVPLIV